MTRTQKVNTKKLVPVSILEGTRISRDGEKPLGCFALDGETVNVLGEEKIGVFVGSSPTRRRMGRLLRTLDERKKGGVVVVVSSGRGLASDLKAHFEDPDDPLPDVTQAPDSWSSLRVAFSVPEGLGDLEAELHRKKETVAAVLVVDPYCVIHTHRGFENRGFYVANDRPQRICDFRDNFGVGDWSPPLVIFADKPAMAYNTRLLLGAYGLEGLWFVEGRLISVPRD